MTADPDSQAFKALAALGISAEAVIAALAQVPLGETSDATPSVHSISFTIGETTTFISDPEVVAALRRLNSDELRKVIKKAIGPFSPDQAAG
jgi:hypothetical protein